MLCWANFVAFWGNGGHRYETGGTFARGCGRLNETDIASASEKRARNGRTWCAEVMWVSAAAELTRAKVLSVSIWWKCSPVGCRRIHLRWLRCPWAVAGPGRASRRRAERSSRRGRRAGGPPPTGTQSSPEHPWGHKQPGPAGHTNHNLRNWAASRPTARSARNATLKSPGHPQCRRRNAPRARQGKFR